MKTQRNRFRPALILLGILCLAGIGIVFKFSSEIGSDHRATLREAPQFELSDSQGRVHKLEDFRGKYVVLHFWASWCSPCLKEIPKWVEFARRSSSPGRFRSRSNAQVVVQFIAVSLDERWEDALRVLPTSQLPTQVISLLDPKAAISEQYGSYQFPETYLLTPDLKIQTKLVGPQDWDSSTIVKWLETQVGSQI